MLICAPRTAQLLNNEIQKAEEQNLPIIPLPRAGGVGWVYSSPQKSLRRTGPIAKYNKMKEIRRGGFLSLTFLLRQKVSQGKAVHHLQSKHPFAAGDTTLQTALGGH